ncbi:Reverse gyrase 1 [uncultured archaeon]|nr:Reverse gyrase 1 [uncultured archaeon]
MKLVICEKPSVAEKIAYALGRGSAAKKALYGVPYYEVERDGGKLVVVSAVGHLYTLKQAKGAREYPAFNIEWAPTHEVEKDADYSKKYLDTIAKLAPGAEEYICACDYDIEGSLIGYNVMRFACVVENGTRMKFSALTPDDLEEAYVGRGKLDLPNALAGEARHMLDWFYGINLSRALMSSIRSAGAHQVMSIGRVQGPALALLARKEKDIGAFASQPYWEVTCIAKGTLFGNTKGRFQKKEEAASALAASASPGTVQKVERKEYSQAPSPPFDLTSLQVEAYRMFNFAPALTLQLAQSLYENTLISYPRTSSQKLPSKLTLRKIIESLSRVKEYELSAKGLLAKNRVAPLEGKKDDPAHPAIHPTGFYKQLGEREMKLYDLIAKRFLSCFAEPARREAQRVEILSGSERYAASGNRTVEQGWFSIYAPYVKLDETTLPPFSQGESVALSDFGMQEKKTQPPKRFTPASLVSELEKHHLGTKATRASVVETLFKRGYAGGTSIKVTPFGMAVFDSLSKLAPEILDEKLTRQIEDEMEKIADGENEKKAIEDGKRVLEGILRKFEGKEKEIGMGLLSGLRSKAMGDSLLGKCPKCGDGELRIIKSKAGRQFVGCTAYPGCTNTYSLPQGVRIVPAGKLCEKCGTPKIRGLRGKGFAFEVCLNPTCKSEGDVVSEAPTIQRPAPAKAAPAAAAAVKAAPEAKAALQAAVPAAESPKKKPAAKAKKPAAAKKAGKKK